MSGRDMDTPARIDDLSLEIAGLKPGNYTVEHWDCGTGNIRAVGTLQVPANGSSQLKIPAFKGDFAVKIFPSG